MLLKLRGLCRWKTTHIFQLFEDTTVLNKIMVALICQSCGYPSTPTIIANHDSHFQPSPPKQWGTEQGRLQVTGVKSPPPSPLFRK